MLMEIIVFTIATMTQDIVFCDDGEAKMFEARKSLWGIYENYLLSISPYRKYDYVGVKYFYQSKIFYFRFIYYSRSN